MNDPDHHHEVPRRQTTVKDSNGRRKALKKSVAATTGIFEEETRTATNQAGTVVGETIATEDGTAMEVGTAVGMEAEILVARVAEEVTETTEIAMWRTNLDPADRAIRTDPATTKG